MKQALLVASFGTAVPEAQESITAVETALKREAAGCAFFRAFTSPTIRRVLAGRGEEIPSLEQALERLCAGGYARVLLQPTHLLYGLEYDKIEAAASRFAPRFGELRLGRPLLADERDLTRLARGLDGAYPPGAGRAVVLLGHGTTKAGNAVYPALQEILRNLGRDDMVVGTVEGNAASGTAFDSVLDRLRDGERRETLLVPLMLVAGGHALTDMAGEGPDSWKSRLESEGYSVRCTLTGLGLLPGVQDLYRAHLRALLEA